MASWALSAQRKRLTPSLHWLLPLKSPTPTWSFCSRPPLFWVLDGHFGGKRGICAADVALFTVTCEAALVGMALQGSGGVCRSSQTFFANDPFDMWLNFTDCLSVLNPNFPSFCAPRLRPWGTHILSIVRSSRAGSGSFETIHSHSIASSALPLRFLQRLLLK